MVQTRMVYSFITFIHFPLGLFLMWKFSKWPSIARTIITVAISVIVLASITYYGNLQMIVPATSNSNNETKETTENNVNDKDERNHKTAVEETKLIMTPPKKILKNLEKKMNLQHDWRTLRLKRQSHIMMIFTCLN